MAHEEQNDPVAQSSASGIPKSPLNTTSSSSESSDTNSFAIIELESRDEVNPVAKEESRGDEEVFEVFETFRAESASAEADFDFSLEKPATRPRDRCGTEQLFYPFVTGFPGSSRVSALAPHSSGGRVGSTLSTPHAGGDVGLFVGECSSPQTDAPNDEERVRLMSLTPPP